MAEISQNKATTDKGESFTVTYGPKRTGYAGGVADSCVLQRLAPSQTTWVEVDTSAGRTNNVSQMFNTVGTYRYRAQCTNDGGSSAWVSLNHIVVTDGTVPTVILEVRNVTADDAWTSGNISINTGDQINLRWDGNNVSTCTGSAFSTGGAVSGTNANVTEPTANSSRTYTVNCTGTNGAASDSLSVSLGVGTTGDVDVDPDIVRKGDTVDVTWTGATGACTLTGPGVNMTNLGPSGSVQVVINGESTYTLTCPGGEDTATVKVLPVIQET